MCLVYDVSRLAFPLERAGWLDPAVTRLNGRPWLELRSVVTFDDGGYVSHAAVADFYLVFVEDLIQCRTL